MSISPLHRLPGQVEPAFARAPVLHSSPLGKAAPWKTAFAGAPCGGASALPPAPALALSARPTAAVIGAGQPLDAQDRAWLQQRLGPALLAALQKLPLRPGLGQADATFGLIEMAGGKTSPGLRMLSLMAGDPALDGATLAQLLNGWAAVTEQHKGATSRLTIQQLCEHGMPTGYMAVLVCAREHGHALAAVATDMQRGLVFCLVARASAATGELRKFDVDAFRALTPRAIGGVSGIRFGKRA